LVRRCFQFATLICMAALRLFENVNKYLNIVSNVLPNKSSKFITLI
jgi:hypothetical protein